MRIAVGGFMHESNTFADLPTDRRRFEEGSLTRGDALAAAWRDAHHEVGGFFEAAAQSGFEAVPTFMAWATPAGPLDAATYAELSDRLLAALRAAGPVDAVVLALHGAMAVDGLDDADGSTLARVRDLIRQADPDVVEEWKWRGVPIWEHAGIICTGETYKAAVKLTFAHGAKLDDPSGLFNASLDGGTRRAIDIHQGEKLNEPALKALIRAAVALNAAK